MRAELRAMLSLAWPVILSEIGWVLMGVVDAVIVGPLGPAAIGGVGSGSGIFFAFMVVGIGILFALDTFVSQSFGASNFDDCLRWLIAGLQLAVLLSALLIAVGWLVVALLPAFGIHPDVLPVLQPYLAVLLWSVLPLLLFTVLRRYLQAINHVRPIMAAIVVANVVNAIADWALVYGHLGSPVFGAIGAAYATVLSRVFLLGWLCAMVIVHLRRQGRTMHHMPLAVDVARIGRLVTLGLPAAGQLALEVGVFATATTLAARISPAALAAHQIVLNIASLFFMIPYGLSSAAAVRVGHAMGRCDAGGAARAGWSALLLSSGFAIGIATLLVAVPVPLLEVFSRDAGVLGAGVTLLYICALFQPFDGFQVVSTGALRGMGDTRTPMFVNLGGHWALGLPVGSLLCFGAGWGVMGLWVGLALGLVTIGAVLVLVWWRRSRTAMEDETRTLSAAIEWR
jgi:MATE family multidrug resistance protein